MYVWAGPLILMRDTTQHLHSPGPQLLSTHVIHNVTVDRCTHAIGHYHGSQSHSCWPEALAEGRVPMSCLGLLHLLRNVCLQKGHRQGFTALQKRKRSPVALVVIAAKGCGSRVCMQKGLGSLLFILSHEGVHPTQQQETVANAISSNSGRGIPH